MIEMTELPADLIEKSTEPDANVELTKEKPTDEKIELEMLNRVNKLEKVIEEGRGDRETLMAYFNALAELNEHRFNMSENTAEVDHYDPSGDRIIQNGYAHNALHYKHLATTKDKTPIVTFCWGKKMDIDLQQGQEEELYNGPDKATHIANISAKANNWRNLAVTVQGSSASSIPLS